MRKLTQGKQTRKLLTPLFEAIASKSKIKKYYEVLDRTTTLGEVHGNYMLCYDKRTRNYSVRQRIRDGSNGKIVFVTVCSATTFKEARDWMIDKSIEKVQPFYDYLQEVDEIDGMDIGTLELLESSNIDLSDPLFWSHHIGVLPSMKDPRRYDYKTGALLKETGNVRYQPNVPKGIVWKNVDRLGGDTPFGMYVEKVRLAVREDKKRKRDE